MRGLIFAYKIKITIVAIFINLSYYVFYFLIFFVKGWRLCPCRVSVSLCFNSFSKRLQIHGSKNLKFWCTIFRAPCVDFWCTRAPQKNLAPLRYFSVSRAPYRTPYRKDFKFICLQISYDLMYLKLFVIY